MRSRREHLAEVGVMQLQEHYGMSYQEASGIEVWILVSTG
jgi:hypothetical protein